MLQYHLSRWFGYVVPYRNHLFHSVGTQRKYHKFYVELGWVINFLTIVFSRFSMADNDIRSLFLWITNFNHRDVRYLVSSADT